MTRKKQGTNEVPGPGADLGRPGPCSTGLVPGGIRLIDILLETPVLPEAIRLSRVVELLESCARGRDCSAQPLQLRFRIVHERSLACPLKTNPFRERYLDPHTEGGFEK